MFRFVSSLKPTQLKKAYLKLFNVALLQKKLDKLLMDYPEVKSVMPDDLSANKLLIGKFEYLAKVYCAFIGYLNSKSEDERTDIKSAFVGGGFNYENHKSKIGRFLMNPANGFSIHNCVYCDLIDVRSFQKANGQTVRKFETEHVLDKGECPLVSLSLYNFVPSCWICNRPDIKGTKTIGDTEDEIARLSPTIDGYDFNMQVKFEVTVFLPGVSDLDAVSHPQDYEIGFRVRNRLYQKSINLFELKSRYNEDLIKIDLLSWREKRKRNPNNIVQQMADLQKVSFPEMFEQMFELDKRRKAHFPMEKARREVMLMF